MTSVEKNVANISSPFINENKHSDVEDIVRNLR